MKVFLLLVAFAFFITPRAIFSCSALSVSAKNSVLLGRNLDWDFDHGLIISNPRDLEKTALIGKPLTPVKWKSKFGSVTFNQVGRELPYGGMNEGGLAVEALWLSTAQFPDPGNEPTINELQWVQYQLDRYATLAEVISNLQKLKMIKKVANLHYFICDASGACGVVDPIGGKLIVHSGDEMTTLALTNNTYEDSLKASGQFKSAAKFSALPKGTKSLDRFARLSFLLKNKTQTSSVESAFKDLENVKSEISNQDDSKTQWSIVSDLAHKIIYFKTSRSPSIKTIDLSKINFSCEKRARALDINMSAKGEVTNHFVDYSIDKNLDIVRKSLETGFAHLPPEAIQRIASYPDQFICGI